MSNFRNTMASPDETPTRDYCVNHSADMSTAPLGDHKRGLLRDTPLPSCIALDEDFKTQLDALRPFAPEAATQDLIQASKTVRQNLVEFQKLRREVVGDLQARNEDARNAEIRIEAEIAQRREERDRADARMLDQIDVARKSATDARAIEIEARDLAGEDVADVVRDMAAAERSIAERSEAASAPQTAAAPAQRGLAALTARLPWKRPAAPTAPVAAPPHAFGAMGGPATDLARNDAMPATSGPTVARYVVGDIEPSVTVRARPIEAIALEHGLPTKWFSSRVVRAQPAPDADPWARFGHLVVRGWDTAAYLLPTLVCGSIFGLGFGQVLGLVDLRGMMLVGEVDAVPMVVSMTGGTVVFGLIGRTVQPSATFAAETAFHGLIGAGDGLKAGVAKVMQAKALAATFWLAGCVGLLVAIESIVERQGLIRTFLERDLNRQLASGTTGGGASGPSPIETWALVLSVVVPYVLQRMTSSWIHGWTAAARTWLEGIRAAEVAAIRKEEHLKEEERLAETNALLLERHNRSLDPTVHVAPMLPPFAESAPAADLDEALEEVDEESLAAPDEVVESAPWMPTLTATENATHGGRHVASPAAAAAIARVRRLEAERHVARLEAKRIEALAEIAQDIARLETRRQSERTEIDDVARRRVDAAYGRLVRSAKAFDRLWKRYVDRCDRRQRKDLGARIRRPLMDDIAKVD